MKKNIILTILIIILIGSVMVLAYVSNKETSVTQTPPAFEQKETSQGDSALELEELTFLTQDATKEEKDRFRELTRSLAKESTIVTIDANCTPNPLVLKVKVDEPITIQNVDSIEHRLSREGESTEIVILPNDSTTFLLSDFVEYDLDLRGGVVRYRCDAVLNGVFYVTSSL